MGWNKYLRAPLNERADDVHDAYLREQENNSRNYLRMRVSPRTEELMRHNSACGMSRATMASIWGETLVNLVIGEPKQKEAA